MPAVGSARGPGMTMAAQNLADGVNFAYGLSNTTLKLEDFGDSGIERESSLDGAPATYDGDGVEEDVTREIFPLDVDPGSGALTARSLVSHAHTTSGKSSLTSQITKQQVP